MQQYTIENISSADAELHFAALRKLNFEDSYLSRLATICLDHQNDTPAMVNAVCQLIAKRWNETKHNTVGYTGEWATYPYEFVKSDNIIFAIVVNLIRFNSPEIGIRLPSEWAIQNAFFTEIAREFVQLKLVDVPHYYYLLMPSLRNFNIPSVYFATSIIELDLKQALITDDDYLQDIVEILYDFKNTGKLRCQSPDGMRPLSAREINYIELLDVVVEFPFEASSKNHVTTFATIHDMFYALKQHYVPQNPGLTEKTVQAVWELAVGVTLSGGDVGNYSPIQNVLAYAAVKKFQIFMAMMPTQERQALQGYLITRPEAYDGTAATFAQVWDGMTKHDADCIYRSGVYYHKLVYDFRRNLSSVFNTVGKVLGFQQNWKALEKKTLEFVSPETYVDTAENIAARTKMLRLKTLIEERHWSESGWYSLTVDGGKKINVPFEALQAVNLINAEAKAVYPNWEAVQFQVIKLFTERGTQELWPWNNRQTHIWFRQFVLDDRYLDKITESHADNDCDIATWYY